MTEPSTFLTMETLRTLAGQVLVVGMVTQVVRSAVPELSTYCLRAVAVAAGILLHGVLAWQAGMPVSSYVLAFANGAAVALTAMKAVELVKQTGGQS